MLPDNLNMTRYWKSTLWLTAGLLLLWAVVTFGLPFFVHTLRIQWLGGPFSFWMTAQGSLLVYLTIVAIYGWAMNRWDGAAAPDDRAPE
jgi:putative solute:sodium symporter small subunit